MVALSGLDTNLLVKVCRYRNELACESVECGSSQKHFSINKNEKIVSQLRKPNKKLNDEEISELVVAYKSGLTVYQLADQFGCYRTTVSQHLKSRGVNMRNRPMTEIQIEKAIELYKSGLSCAKIGKIIEVDAGTIHRRLRDHGVKLRRIHG